jgi:hypothetical protein
MPLRGYSVVQLLESVSWFATFKDKYGYARYLQYYYSIHDQNMERGVKIHISATENSAKHLALAILPYLNDNKTPHKILADADRIKDAKEDNQARKFITIYPQNAEELDEVADGIDDLLYNGRLPIRVGPTGADCYKISHDLPYGRAGYIFLRHGAFVEEADEEDPLIARQRLRSYYMEDKIDGLFVGLSGMY